MFWRTFLLFIALFCVVQSWNIGQQASVSSSSGTRRNFLTQTSSAIVLGSSAAAVVVGRPLPGYAVSTVPSVGILAPDFDLPNSQGEGSTTLSSLTKDGKWTILYFYPGAFTSGCTLEARGFQRDIEQYRAFNAQVVGVSVDPVEKNAQFCAVEKLDFFMLTDEKGDVSKLYGSALTVPGFGTFSNRQTYIIDPQGYLRWVFTDVESRVARHSSEVLAKLEELSKAPTA